MLRRVALVSVAAATFFGSITVVKLLRLASSSNAPNLTTQLDLPERSYRITNKREFWIHSYSKQELDYIRNSKKIRAKEKKRKRTDGSQDRPEDEDDLGDDCTAIEDLQISHPQCNALHELDLGSRALQNSFQYIASGGSNEIFKLSNRNISLALKVTSKPPIEYRRRNIPHVPEGSKYNNLNFDIVRRDALVNSLLSSSPHALDLYGYCGLTTLVPFADGVLGYELKNNWDHSTLTQRLKWATEAAQGLAALHDVGSGGVSPSVVHGDLTINQFFIRDGSLQIGDYNLGLFLKLNTTSNEACTFILTTQFATFGSPEEYKGMPQTSKIDVWALGSVLHHILYGEKVWANTKKDAARKQVIKGKLPSKRGHFDHNATINQVLLKARNMCYVYDPNERATAREVAQFLETNMKTKRHDKV